MTPVTTRKVHCAAFTVRYFSKKLKRSSNFENAAIVFFIEMACIALPQKNIDLKLLVRKLPLNTETVNSEI